MHIIYLSQSQLPYMSPLPGQFYCLSTTSSMFLMSNSNPLYWLYSKGCISAHTLRHTTFCYLSPCVFLIQCRPLFWLNLIMGILHPFVHVPCQRFTMSIAELFCPDKRNTPPPLQPLTLQYCSWRPMQCLGWTIVTFSS